MAPRPRVFEVDVIRSKLREQGVSEADIGPTIAFMRLVIPVVLQAVGENEIIRMVEQRANDFALTHNMSWARSMAPRIVAWATECTDEYRTARLEPTADDDGD